MAKIKHNNFIDTVDTVFSNAKEKGILHLYAEDEYLNGRTIKINGSEMLHFGTTGYLGLEQDKRLKEAAINAIRNYGTQFPLSKTYLSHPLYAELESKIEQMYSIPPIITKNSTLGHIAIIPTLIRDEDAVIMDHQAHWSVQNASQILKLRGIPVEMIRHNNLEMLEDKIRTLMGKSGKIWYMADGVYSMYGDYAPVQELLNLARKYPQLHLYFDDVHGMSWKGKNGTGFIFDAIGTLEENIVVVSTLSKTFGASGATFFCSDRKLREKIKTFGGPLTFSAQLEPASVAAAIASCDIHLSAEIYEHQTELNKKTAHFSTILSKSSLPLVSENDSPVFFLGMGTPATAYNFTKRLFSEGFYLNLGIYPAVPIKNTGIRITISAHNKIEDITDLARAMDHHFHKAVEETGSSEEKIRQAFTMYIKMKLPAQKQQTELKIEETTTIAKIDKQEWNKYLGTHNILNWEGMQYLEQTFANAQDPGNKWDFFYYIIRDQNMQVVLMTFCTFGIWKDDMLATESVSRHLEETRKTDPMYMTSKVLSTGSLFTEGLHCYIDQDHPMSEQSMKILLNKLEESYNTLSADMLVLRDFESGFRWDEMIRNQGYFRIDMPESCAIAHNHLLEFENYGSLLSTRSSQHFNREILKYEKFYDVQIKDCLNEAELNRAYSLYCNVKERNLAVNTFTYSKDVFANMNSCPNWEFIILRLKDASERDFIGIMFCYKNSDKVYVPELIGMDYIAGDGFNLYRQLLYQTIKRARELQIERIDFGISASFEKKKLGASIIPKIAYVQARDNYAMELMQTLQNETNTAR
ncbi:7-keto-8-aminopelargonate synthetase-like enzyme [Flavobacterium sp. HSC-32F16]|uniref:bifunctional aminotransferase class I/II-fold pyridoxal phosphate-dependent enzyme/GNAT family N-acetyltransferase n=1 Tax=Flavobacterium sp. HSC-32F16 TaxID=2910964 RepID=UPI0020A3D620|nr:bifunctional aminotransferase class I/II-fold pyridoxal phosphate-dependent enzyme/GNAT family N-acetyltransferase [Flavobacterium sp. HSC-32F16]MCP2025761.1 7-keto-8-aminopelargonate synthetase-like enzyme [Flavobacterium sp. HSC-32F16]